MPTGYTADIEKGITFQQFALSCARAFGSCITMRGDPHEKPIPDEFKPSDWHLKELAEVERRLTELDTLGIDEATQLAVKDYESESGRISSSIKKDRKLMSQYKAMLEKVRWWEPPTPDHIEFKAFMIDQIEGSVKFDGMEEYYLGNPAILLSGEKWLRKEKEKATWGIEYHTREHQAEVDRAKERTAWVKALRDSLPEEE